MNATYKNLFKTKTNVRTNTGKRMLMHFSLNALGAFFPNQTRSLIKQSFFKPTKRRTTAKEQEWLDRAANYQIRVHDKTIQCWKWGDGPPILAVHGWNGRGINLHPLFAPLLQRGFSVFTFDAAAHGASEGKHTNYFEMTDTVRAMVSAMGKRSVVGMVAHSLGGSAVINCLSKEDMNPNTVLIAPALRLRELLYNTFRNHGVPANMYTSIIRELESKYGYSIERDNPFLLLEQADIRVMIAHDQSDALIPFADAKILADRYRNIGLYATQGLGHQSILSDPHTIKRVIHQLTQPVSGPERRRISA